MVRVTGLSESRRGDEVHREESFVHMKHVSAASVAGVSGTLAVRGRRDEDDEDKDDSDDDDEKQGREQSETHSVRSVTRCTRQETLHVHLEILYRDGVYVIGGRCVPGAGSTGGTQAQARSSWRK